MAYAPLSGLTAISGVRGLWRRGRDRGGYAELELQHRDRVITVDCRPSDGIAMAVRLGVPIVAADELGLVLAAA